jgi:hypothetical protein
MTDIRSCTGDVTAFGVVVEVLGGDADARKTCNRALDSVWEEDAGLGFNVMLPSGDFLSSFDRAIRAVVQHRLDAGSLRALVAWNGPRRTTAQEARVASEVLLEAAKSGDKNAASTGLDFIHFELLRSETKAPMEYLISMFGDEALAVPFGLLEESIDGNKNFSHWFPRMLEIAMPTNSQRAMRLVLTILGNNNYEARQAASGLLSSVAKLDAPSLPDHAGLTRGSSGARGACEVHRIIGDTERNLIA